MNKYENIIFDFGGVIINLDFQRTNKEFGKLSNGRFEDIFSKEKQNPLFDQFEIGKITPEEFREGLTRLFEFTATPEQIDYAWNRILLDIPVSRVQFLQSLKHRKKIFLLSNTNLIHEIQFRKIYQESHSGVLDDLFHGVYLSHRVQDRKPNASIFHRVLEDHDLNPKTTLFIDDSLQHIEGANKVGLNTLHLKPEMDIVDLNELQS